MSCKPRPINKFLSLLGVSLGGALSFAGVCTYRGDETFYSKFLMPIVAKYMDPELAHEACILMTRHRLIRCREELTPSQTQLLKTTVFGFTFVNPVGLAAGFDKNCQSLAGLPHYGLGFAEVGTVTPQPQDGNPKPRIFRSILNRALVNRCGFNNLGLDQVVENIATHKKSGSMLLGVNLGKNKHSNHPTDDYLVGLEKVANLEAVDYIVINISSPNTPGLRDLQEKTNLDRLVKDALTKMHDLSIEKPLLLKIAPDLVDSQLKDIVDVITDKKFGNKKIDGIILTNTTIWRPEGSDNDPALRETGGLSGAPLRDMSTNTIAKFYALTGGKIPIVGVGGVFSGQDAYDKIRAGASLVQIYTGITYEGPPIVNRVKRELAELLERDGLSTVSSAVGLDSNRYT